MAISKLTVSGAGWATDVAASSDDNILAILGVADASAALNVVLYASATKPSGSISQAPADAEEVGTFRAPLNTVTPGVAFPLGLPIGQAKYLYANFIDAGTGHILYVYTK